MPTKEQLQKMTADEVYQEALNKGYYRAVNQSVGSKPDAVKDWFLANEEFGGSDVKELIKLGEKNALNELIRDTQELGITLLVDTPKKWFVFENTRTQNPKP